MAEVSRPQVSMKEAQGLGSWHPALRPDTHPSEVDDGTARQNASNYFFEAAEPHDPVESVSPQAPLSEKSATPENEAVDVLEPRPDRIRDDVREPATSSNSTDDTSKRVGGAPYVTFSSSSGQLDNKEGLGHTDSEPRMAVANYEGLQEEDVFDGEDREIDPAWGLSSNALGMELPQMNHTNSFPEVPPLHRPSDSIPSHPLSHSQAGAIMEEMEESESGHERIEDGLMDQLDLRPQSSKSDFFAAADNDASFFDHHERSGGEAAIIPPDEEARFEEGLKLIAANPQQKSLVDGAQTNNDGFFSNEAEKEISEDDFFANISTSQEDAFSTFSKPQTLDRKSTTQILNSFQYQPHEKIHDREQLPQDVRDRVPMADLARESELSPTAPPDSDLTLQQEVSRENNSGIAITEEVAPKDEDLAALWQAALADDDFLEDESTLDPGAFFDEDGDGFLEEPQNTNFDQASSSSVGVIEMQNSGTKNTSNDQSYSARSPRQDRYTPRHEPPAFAPAGNHSNPAHQPRYATSGFQNSFAAAPGLHNRLGQQPPSYGTQNMLSRPSIPEKTESFVDKGKGGYTSPYDLPMDMSRPRKRNTTQQSQHQGAPDASGVPPPPPRSSSIQSTVLPVHGQPSYSDQDSTTGIPTSNAPLSMASPILPQTNTAILRPPTKSSSGSFFEDLPIASKPRPSSSAGRFTPQQSQHYGPHPSQATVPPPPEILPHQGNFNQFPPSQQLPLSLAQTHPPSLPASQDYQLLPPERKLPFANDAPHEAQSRPMPAMNTRYSPAPPSQPHMPPNRNRYETPPVAAGPPRPPSVSQALPFQPRTSSPLARSVSSPYQNRRPSQPVESSMQMGEFPTTSRRPSLKSAQTAGPVAATQKAPAMGSPMGEPGLGENVTSRSVSYQHPLQQSQILSPDNRSFAPPQRPQTYSPEELTNGLSLTKSQPQRPPSVHDKHAAYNRANIHDVSQPRQTPQAGSRVAPSLNYIIPSDGQEHDPLERWKGCPIINFGFGGNLVTSFPKHIPRYGAGQAIPMIKCVPGEVKIQTGRILPLDEHITKFPGPLKSKSKKKEVLEWLTKCIQQLERQEIHIVPNQTEFDRRKRHEEKVLLWKTLHVLVEYDGVVDGNTAAEKAVRDILSPGLASVGPPDQPSYDLSTRPRGISRSSISQSTPVFANPEAVEGLRRALLQGEREKAVWYAVDKRLWGHAMLISSTMPKEIWKQVIQEFVRHEVRTVGDNTESLAAMYDVFAGNWEESVDQLVPPSARAGLQMMSKTQSLGTSKDALDGLNRWQETLSLILSNRTSDDSRALVALGRLLSGYGRVEAAHICFLFAETPGLFGGPEDSQASITLIGADHVKKPFDYGRDVDSVFLTEIYEFIFAVLTPSSISTIAPHLQAHKLYHAMILAEYGYREEAQQYCDAITNALKSTTKLSPYYHAQLFSTLDDLSSRLRQAPKEGSSSWIAKPSIDKVSGSVWNKFNQFISGDESDAASTGSGPGIDSAAGPFARVTGDTPSISRQPSPSEQYGSYGIAGSYVPVLPTASPANSRYAPGGQHASATSNHDPHRPSQLDLFKRNDLRKQPSYSSLPATSPDHLRKQLPNPYQQVQRPASTADYPLGAERPLPMAPTQTSYSPEARARRSFDQNSQGSSESNQHIPHPLYHPNDAIPELAYEPGPAAQEKPPTTREGLASPYEPRSGSHRLSPNSERSYAPRSASLGPRSASYLPSPVADKPLPAAPDHHSDSYQPSAPPEPVSFPYGPPSLDHPRSSYEIPSSSYEPVASHEPFSSYQPPSAPLEPPTPYTYEPPASSSYDPPSYDPELQNGELSPVETKDKKKKSFMDDDDDDDDDDFAAKAAALKRQEKAQKDKEADEAFRKAAEADAQKDARPSAPTKSSSWFPSIWGSKAKDPSLSKPGPIKARLGEESSFVYDANLKRWVNKKAGADNTPVAAATPPPPKGPPSRAVSASTGPPGVVGLGVVGLPPSGPPSTAGSRNVSPTLSFGRPPAQQMSSPPASTPSGLPTTLSPPGLGGPTSSPVAGDATSRPGSSSSTAGPGVGGLPAGLAPPSRPPTGMSDAGSIDDLIGAPQQRTGGTVKKAKKARGRVDVLAK